MENFYDQTFYGYDVPAAEHTWNEGMLAAGDPQDPSQHLPMTQNFDAAYADSALNPAPVDYRAYLRDPAHDSYLPAMGSTTMSVQQQYQGFSTQEVPDYYSGAVPQGTNIHQTTGNGFIPGSLNLPNTYMALEDAPAQPDILPPGESEVQADLGEYAIDWGMLDDLPHAVEDQAPPAFAPELHAVDDPGALDMLRAAIQPADQPQQQNAAPPAAHRNERRQGQKNRSQNLLRLRKRWLNKNVQQYLPPAEIPDKWISMTVRHALQSIEQRFPGILPEDIRIQPSELGKQPAGKGTGRGARRQQL